LVCRSKGDLPFGHWKTTTFTAGLRYDVNPCTLGARLAHEPRDAFLVHVDKVLGHPLSEDDVVAMDNLPADKDGAVKALVEARGAKTAVGS
jgi:hypothetical protein